MIIEMKRYTRAFIQAHTDWIFCFGDNEDRKGTGGQAKACRGEPNTIGIRTKRHPNRRPDAYWDDATFPINRMKVTEDFMDVLGALMKDKVVVFPKDGFGTGLANLDKNAPRTLEYIESGRKSFLEYWGTDFVDPSTK